ncbi:MAG: pantetheine-phosphate adenylyltransferase [Thermoplasmata archaeon]
MPRYARAVLGGTFDHLHVGHEALLATAFQLGRTVAIGLTTEAYLAAHAKPGRGRIQSFRVRRSTLVRWLEREFPGRPFEIRPLEDRFGGSVERGVSVLVVSSDTADGGRAVNRERRRRNVPPVPVAVVPLVLADDLRPVSSRRIRSGEIDRTGRRRSPIPITLVVRDPRDLAWVTRGIRSAFPRARIIPPRRRTTSGAAAPLPEGLAVTVTRMSDRGWTIRESSDRIHLPARVLDDPTPALLARGMHDLLRPMARRA